MRLFYVGGMSDHYRLHKLVWAVNGISGIELTLCTRVVEWEAVRSEYDPLPPNVRVIHEFGSAVEEQLQESDISVLCVEPREYWKFASPVKLYEYLGFNCPVIATVGTLAASFVEENRIGWSVAYDVSAIRALLLRLRDSRIEVSEAKQRASVISRSHTWIRRAERVAYDLID